MKELLVSNKDNPAAPGVVDSVQAAEKHDINSQAIEEQKQSPPTIIQCYTNSKVCWIGPGGAGSGFERWQRLAFGNRYI